MMRKQQAGFSLIETMVALIVLLAVSAIVMTGMTEMMHTQGTLANRTEMHTSVRGATELLEQEIGQAGKISLPQGGPWLMLTPIVLVLPDKPVTTTVVFSDGLTTLFDNEQLLVDTGPSQETITITCGLPAAPTPGACTNIWTAGPFYYNHAQNVPISAPGAFATGVVPPATGFLANPPAGYVGYPNGSTDTVLKLYGDINGDGQMMYVEYTCVPGTPAAPGFLYRNEVPFNSAAAAKTWSPTKPIPSTALLSNVLTNPKDPSGAAVPCFKYQVSPVGNIPVYTANASQVTNVKEVYVTDVAVTLTEQTQNADPQTNAYQQETKALLNVAPRNVFNAYLLARADETNRVQPMPLSLYNNLLYP